MRIGATTLLPVLIVASCGSSSSDSSPAATSAAGAAGVAGAATAGGAAGATTAGSAGAGAAGVGGAAGAAASSSGLAVTLSAKLKTVDAVGNESFDVGVTLVTTPASAITLTHARLFFVHDGGFAYLVSDVVKKTGSLYGVGPVLDAGKTWSLPLKYVWSSPVSHAVLAVAGTDGSDPFETIASAPLVRAGYADPDTLKPTGPAQIGVRGPLVRVQTWKGSTVIPAVAQIVPWTARPFAATSLAVDVGGGPVDLGKPVTVLGMPTYVAAPTAAAATTATFTASYTIDGAAQTLTRAVPIIDVVPLQVSSPVKGTWRWLNGPCETVLHTHHQFPEQRFAYDILVEQGGATYSGDAKANASYFAFDQPFFAATAGKVVFVDDSRDDNDGSSPAGGNPDGINNQLVIERDDGVRCAYAHLRKGSSTVKAGDTVAIGDTLGRVGNAGQSSEPHLHFSCFRVDATGRVAALPLSLTIGADTGTPVGGEALTTP